MAKIEVGQPLKQIKYINFMSKGGAPAERKIAEAEINDTQNIVEKARDWLICVERASIPLNGIPVVPLYQKNANLGEFLFRFSRLGHPNIDLTLIYDCYSASDFITQLKDYVFEVFGAVNDNRFGIELRSDWRVLFIFQRTDTELLISDEMVKLILIILIIFNIII